MCLGILFTHLLSEAEIAILKSKSQRLVQILLTGTLDVSIKSIQMRGLNTLDLRDEKSYTHGFAPICCSAIAD